MNKTVKWLIIAVILIGTIIAASVLYNNLSGKYSGGNLSAETDRAEEETESLPEDTNKEGTNKEDTNKEESSKSDRYMKAPNFTVIDEDGNEVKLSDYIGKPIVINFWTSWCYFCELEMPDFQIAAEKYPDVQFMMVNATTDIKESLWLAKRFINQHNFELDFFFDTEADATSAYFVSSFPVTFFVDAEGYLVAHGYGMLNLEHIENGIKMATEE